MKHQPDPMPRLLAALSLLLGLGLCSSLPLLGLAGLAGLLAARLSGFGWAVLLRRVLALDGLVLLTVGTLPLTVPGDAVWQWGRLALSQPGLELAFTILLRANAAALLLLALLGPVGPQALGRALGRLGLPPNAVHLLLFTLRYISVLQQEYDRLRQSMRARGFRLGCNRHSWRTIGYLFGMLLVRSLERAERISAAMRCRGFNGHFPSLEEPAGWRHRDGAMVLASLAGSGVLSLAGWG